MTKAEAAKSVATLVCAYPGTKWTDENAAMYETLLIDMGFEETLAAVRSLGMTAKFMPVPAEIREEVIRARKRERERIRPPQLPPAGRGPSPQEWGKCLSGMLGDQSRFERMAKGWAEKNGRKYRGDPGAQMVNLSALGARGEDVRERFSREVLNDQDEQERRHP